MKKYLLIILLALMATSFIISCDDDSSEYCTVTYKVSIDDDNLFVINGFHGDVLISKGKWEHTETTSDTFADILVTSDNETSLLTVEIFKNGRLLDMKQGNSWVHLKVSLK